MGSGEEGAEGGESWQRNGGGVGGVTLCVCVCIRGVQKRRFVEESERGGGAQRFRTGETSTCRMLPHFFLHKIQKVMLFETLLPICYRHCLHSEHLFKHKQYPWPN